MINPSDLLQELINNDVEFFCGVPDSLLKDFCACLETTIDNSNHIITANEGNAIALASGYHLATNKIPLVYMQNSGLGNALNPLISLADKNVYQIPILLLIGWRGEPGKPDEPQHQTQGEITPALLETLKIPFEVFSGSCDYLNIINRSLDKAKETSSPVAILVQKGCFEPYTPARKTSNQQLLREKALETILELAQSDDLFISTTGKTSRELYELRCKNNQSSRDFLTVGSMGHASSIALGVALAKTDKRIICLDGDGALLMQMGAMTTIGKTKPKNLIHILLNNECHESVGEQKTGAENIDFESLSTAVGYSHFYLADSLDVLKNCWNDLNSQQGPIFLEIKLKPGSRDDLGRPQSSPVDNKIQFMEHINE